MVLNYFICIIVVMAGFYILIFQKDTLKFVAALSMIWFGIIIFIISLNIGINNHSAIIVSEIKNIVDPFLQNTLIISNIIRFFTLTSCLIMISKIKNNDDIALSSNIKEDIK